MTKAIRRVAAVVAASIVVAWPRPSSAQQTVADVLTFLMTNQSISTGDFERDRAAALATSETISRALLASIATLPITSSSSARSRRARIRRRSG